MAAILVENQSLWLHSHRIATLNFGHTLIVGRDRGATVAWRCALLRLDIFHAIALFSVPYRSRSWERRRPTETLKRMAGKQQSYMLYFRKPGKAEVELEADACKTISMFLYSVSGTHH
jgi:pimeloyl-ACP methyl ester carboxylesterase